MMAKKVQRILALMTAEIVTRMLPPLSPSSLSS